MTYPLVIYVSLMTICVFVPVLCQPSQCNLTTSNRFIKSGQWPSFSSHDSRDLVEYFVTYINDDDERVTFDMTNTTNSTRFQPMRWFNINQKILYIMPMIYDYYFSITRYFMNIQTIHIDLNVTPKNCIYSIDYEEVEILTRKFFIDNILFADSQFCSASIVDQNGIGVVSFNCCKVAESPNETVCSEINEGVTYLTSVNIAAIIASTFILGVIFVLILLSPTGTEDFYFYPKNMVIDYTKIASNTSRTESSSAAPADSSSTAGTVSMNTPGQETGEEQLNYRRGKEQLNYRRGEEQLNYRRDKEQLNYRRGEEQLNYRRGEEQLNYRRGEEQLNYRRGEEQLNYRRGEEQLNYRRGEEQLNYRRGEKQLNHRRGEEQLNHRRGEEQLNHRSGEEQMNHRRGEEQLNYRRREEQLNYRRREEQLNYRRREEQLNYRRREEQLNYRRREEQLNYRKGEEQLNYRRREEQSNYRRREEQLNYRRREEQLNYRRREEQLNYRRREEQLNYRRREEQLNYRRRENVKMITFSFQKPSENLNKCFGCCYNDCSSCICCSEKPSENPNKYFGCCYNKCSCICCSKDHPILFPFIRFYLGKLVFVVFSLMFFLPYYLFVVKFENDSMASNILCSAVEAKGLSCPFYVKNTSNLFKYLFWAYCVLLCGYLIFVPRDNCITMIIPELPWTKSKDTSCSSRPLEYIQIVVNLGLIIFVYVTWGFLLYFYIALILRILIMSSRTRNILDDFSFVIFPLFLVVYDYITNVTKEFKVIAENIFDLVRNDKEFKCSSNNPNEKTNEAFLLSGEDQKIECNLVTFAWEKRLNVNCPFIFRRRDGRMYTSKRLVTQIYNDSPECLPFELSAYLKAFLISLVPCTLYAIAFIVFVTYTSILSSTQVAGFTATILTGLKWLQSNVGAFLREILIPKESAKVRVKEKLKQERLNFHEAWTVAIEDTVSSEQSNKKVEENPQQSDTQNKENPQQSDTQNKENPQQSDTQNKNTQVELQKKFKKKSTDNSQSKRKKKDTSTIEMEEFNEKKRLLEDSQDNPTYSANA
ncbi:hypothetical protein Bpfe_006614 [Biomphalaria pfeifferi]|uniref:Uncharacterized protein n=1 Tax=Biomphalaria pfeifferi TaxID=112525 RepID=A0AAD8BZV8_BIOPF|nr:hypothetical protein Bpfe_006614 [Biomphalaria pfeifferi]